MQPGKIFTCLKKVRVDGTLTHYNLYYKAELLPGYSTIKITPNPNVVGFDNMQESHQLYLEVQRGNSADQVSREGVIKITGVEDRTPWYKQKVYFGIKDLDGSLNPSDGTVAHYGDADD